MKRRLLTIAIFLLAGAVVNVAVAWGLSVVWGGQATYDDLPVAAQRIWDRYAPEAWPPFDDYASASSWGRSGEKLWSTVHSSTGRRDRSVSLHGQTSFAMPPPSPRGDFIVGQVRVGLPFRTFQYGWYHHDRESVPFNAWLARPEPRCLIIPYELLWPGFAGNTAFYAAVLWLLIPGPFALHRLIRRRRGLCPACGYDRRHAEHEVCPECGVTG